MLASIALTLLSLQPDERVLHRRDIGGWTVTRVAESDGGEVVRLRRAGHAYHLEHEAVFWRGNGGVIRGTVLRYGACGSGDAPLLMSPETDLSAAAMRRRFGEYFAECAVPAAEQARIMRGFAAAYAQFSRYARDAAACADAENARIVNHGAAPAEQVPVPRCPG